MVKSLTIMMEPVQVGNILIDLDRFAQLDASRVIVSISRENFLSGEIAIKRVCKHPFILTIIAVAMIVLGSMTVLGVVDWWFHGGPIFVRATSMVLLLPGGFFFLYEAWRDAPMLIIATPHGTRRIEFKGGRTKESVTKLERAALERGYILRCGAGDWGDGN
jgi:hypothetical protein